MKVNGQDVHVVIFDLFGVVLSFDNDIVYSRLARYCADPAGAIERLGGLMARREIITGKLSLAQIHRQLIDAEGLSLSYLAFERAWLEPYSKAMPGMAELIKALSADYTLVLLSNVDAFYWEVVRQMHPELHCFESLLLSWEVGLAKPDAEIFLHACRVIGAEPAQCYFVDDTPANIDAAMSLGFHAHWFRGIGGLKSKLVQARAKGP